MSLGAQHNLSNADPVLDLVGVLLLLLLHTLTET